jgi:uncharacterized surface protein with fasciclin (FAS1) repeats
MIRIKSFLFALMAFASVSTFVSCAEEDDTTPAKKTIVDAVSNEANLSLLKAAVIHAGLDGTLATTQNITVFAPTNDAFIKAGFKDEAAIKAADKATIASILTYHVLAQKVTAADIKTADNQELTMLSTNKSWLTKDANGVSINAAKVTKADVAADNGVIHVIDAVILPPSKNIVELVLADANLSLLKEAVVRASSGKTNLASILTTGAFTVFAPTNKAFESAGFNSKKIAETDPDFLAKVITHHAIAARVFSTNLKSGTAKSVQGDDLTIDAAKATVKGSFNSSASNITAVNVLATNGVVHVIDAVLLPK